VTKLDDMLKQWPMRESSQLEVDESAERVTAALSAGQMPATIDESILAAPLPKTPEEGQTSAPRTSRPSISGPATAAVENKMSKDRTRDRTSFQELAKLASTTPPPPTAAGSMAPPPASISGAVVRGKEADSSDSGIVDLKMMAAMDPSASERAQSTPLAASGLFEDESAPPKPAVSAAVAQEAIAAPASSAAPAVAQTAAAAPMSAKASLAPKKVEEKKGGGGVVIVLGALVAAAAIAAGGFFFIKHQRTAQAPIAAATATTTVATPSKATTTATALASVAITDTQEQGNEVAVDPNQAGKPSMGRFRAKHGGPVATATGGGDTTPPPAGTVDPKLVANIPTGGAGGGSGDLQEAMKTAAGGGTGLGAGGGAQTNTQAAGNVAQRPSQGQVAGAIGSVMPAAKACLNGDEPMSRATVTFQSDGTVKSVNVSGFAAGKPQEACIKTALSKATVSPFAEATYPVPVTIRSN
jgi:hypothetical protein